MSPPTELDLAADQAWTAAPMPGSSHPLDLVRLASAPGRFTILGRFPAGFARPVAGGYAVSEEFLVLDGELELEGTTYRRGDLTVVPAWYRRTGMRSPGGCRVLAWFGGRAAYLPEDQLQPCTEPIVSVAVGAGDALPASPLATWAHGAAPDGPGPLEAVSAELDRWVRAEALQVAEADLVRRELR